MGPLSAVALSVFLILYGLSGIGWITANGKTLGIFALIAAVVILLDTFWWNSYGWWVARRNPQ